MVIGPVNIPLTICFVCSWANFDHLTVIGFGLDTKEWAIVFLTYAVLTGLELLNSAIESLANYVQPEEHPAMKRAKDLAAGAVLCAAIFAVAIGILLFLPKILQHFSQA